jgi:hypothetical protein
MALAAALRSLPRYRVSTLAYADDIALRLGKPASSTQVLVRMPRADSAEATGAFRKGSG